MEFLAGQRHSKGGRHSDRGLGRHRREEGGFRDVGSGRGRPRVSRHVNATHRRWRRRRWWRLAEVDAPNHLWRFGCLLGRFSCRLRWLGHRCLHSPQQPVGHPPDEVGLQEVVAVVDHVVRLEVVGVRDEPAADGCVDRPHRLAVDDQVVVAPEHLIHQPLGEPDGQLLGEFRRSMAVVTDGDVEVALGDEPRRSRGRLPGLGLVDPSDERPSGAHRRQPRHSVLLHGIRPEVFDQRAETFDDSGDHRCDGRATRHGREHTRTHHGEVRCDIDEVVPPVGVGQVSAIVRRGDEDRLLDPPVPARAGQDVLRETARRQPAAAVSDDVEADPVGHRRHPGEQVRRVDHRVDRQGGVIEADHRVVLPKRRLKESSTVVRHRH